MVQIKFGVDKRIDQAVRDKAKKRGLTISELCRQIFMSGFVAMQSQELHSQGVQESLNALETLENLQ